MDFNSDNCLEEGNIGDSDKSKQEKQNINKYKMALLFIQEKELKRKYENRMELSPEQYRLVNKEWLNNFKNSYNYNEAMQTFLILLMIIQIIMILNIELVNN